MTADEAFEVAGVLQSSADEMKLELDEAQPRTTAEQWNAWDCLQSAASRMNSVAVWLARHDEKKQRPLVTNERIEILRQQREEYNREKESH